MVEAGEGGTHVGSVMNQLEDTSREIKECYERCVALATVGREGYKECVGSIMFANSAPPLSQSNVLSLTFIQFTSRQHTFKNTPL